MHTSRWFFALFLCLAASGLHTARAQAPAFTPLFDGETLDGWVKPYDWGEMWVEDGEIRLRGDKKFFLVTEETYGDFILEADVLVPDSGNSGIMFRSHYEPNRVWGYQAEVDPSPRQWAGGLYDEARRGWLNPLDGAGEAAARAAFRNGTWNRYRIEAVGDHLRIYVNDVLTTDYYDPMDLTGHIALQHHGEQGLVYRFRNVRLQELGRHVWRPLFDGETLDGWHTRPGGTWRVEDGELVGRSTADEPRHGLLLTDARYDDFTVRVRYRAVEGNSGLYFRADEVDAPVGVHGLQAEIDPVRDAGGLYETGGRQWVVRPTAEEVAGWYRPDAWNEMTVSAHGGRVVVHVNGTRTAELVDDPGRPEGHLGLQLHGGQAMHIRFDTVELLVPEEM